MFRSASRKCPLTSQKPRVTFFSCMVSYSPEEYFNSDTIHVDDSLGIDQENVTGLSAVSISSLTRRAKCRGIEEEKRTGEPVNQQSVNIRRPEDNFIRPEQPEQHQSEGLRAAKHLQEPLVSLSSTKPCVQISMSARNEYNIL